MSHDFSDAARSFNEETAAAVRANFTKLSEEIYPVGFEDEMRTENYIHFKDAVLTAPGQRSIHVRLWRTRTVAIDGFTLGGLRTSGS